MRQTSSTGRVPPLQSVMLDMFVRCAFDQRLKRRHISIECSQVDGSKSVLASKQA